MMAKLQANIGLPETVARGEAVPQEPRALARLPLSIGQAYERFLGLPVPVVLVVLWVLGAVLLGAAVTAACSAAVGPLAAVATP